MNNLSFIIWGLSLVAIVVFIVLAILQGGKKDKTKGKKYLRNTGISAIVMVVSFIIFMTTSEPLEVEKEDVITTTANVDGEKISDPEEPKETKEERDARYQKEIEEKAIAEQKAKDEAEARAKVQAEEEAKAKAAAEAKAKEESIPREYKSALKKAEQYAEMMYMSKKGIYHQLTADFGEGFPADAAQYAVDNIKHDWNANALKKAEQYAEMMSMSDSAIYDQLVSEYGEKFTKEEAQYAIDNLK